MANQKKGGAPGAPSDRNASVVGGFADPAALEGRLSEVEGVAPSTPGDGPRTTAPDRLGGRDAQPAPTERRPPEENPPGARWRWPRRGRDGTLGPASVLRIGGYKCPPVVWAPIEGVAPSTPGDGPRTTAPDRLGGRDAQPAPTERRPPEENPPGARWRWPRRGRDGTLGPASVLRIGGYKCPPVVWAPIEGVAPSTPGDGPRTTAPDRLGGRDAQPAPTERRPPAE